MRVVRAVSHADDRRRNGSGMHGAPRHFVNQSADGTVAARGAVIHRLVRQEPVPGYEDVLDDDGVAAGAAQADDMPDVVDAVFAARDQKAAEAPPPAAS